MVHFNKKLVFAFMAALLVAVGCEKEKPDNNNDDSNGGNGDGADTVLVESISLNQTTLTLAVGETFQLEATVEPEDAEVTLSWESSDAAVATVSSEGLVTGVASGSASISVTAGDQQAVCEVTVEDGQSVEIDMTSMTPEEVSAAIKEALAEGVVRFTMIGEFEKLGISSETHAMDTSSAWRDNPFYGSNVEVIDLSCVTGWPQVDVDGALDMTTWMPATDEGFYGLPQMAFQGRETGADYYNYPELREVILSEEVETIGTTAFYNSPKLEKVVCPGVKYVGTQSFSDCPSLKTIDLPEATAIYNYAFLRSGLTSLDLPKATTFNYGMVDSCASLIEMRLTAPGDFTMKEDPFAILTGSSFFMFETSSCDLVLNDDKNMESGTATPKPASSVSWFGHAWKSISFE